MICHAAAPDRQSHTSVYTAFLCAIFVDPPSTKCSYIPTTHTVIFGVEKKMYPLLPHNIFAYYECKLCSQPCTLHIPCIHVPTRQCITTFIYTVKRMINIQVGMCLLLLILQSFGRLKIMPTRHCNIDSGTHPANN